MRFNKLSISKWQQFQDVEIDFHERLTILTGANGSGKTTILSNILARHYNWSWLSLGTPVKDDDTGEVIFTCRYYNGEILSQDSIGLLEYSNGEITSLHITIGKQIGYNIRFQKQQKVNCFFIPSHRSVFKHIPLKNIPFAKKNREQAFSEVSNANKNRYSGESALSPSYYMKNTLIGWAIQGYGVKDGTKEIMPSDQKQIEYFKGFKDVLKKILPKSLGFEEFEIIENEIVFVCNQGKDEFILEQVSGGISTLIDIAWQIYMYSTEEHKQFTVIIDEIENHLHPIMQRQILPDLMEAFPQACFIVSTHSPLIVGSVRNSNVYVLKYNKNDKIISQKLDLVNKAKTASEILDEVLGVSFTMPIWAERNLKTLINLYSQKEMTKDDFAQLRSELAEIGLENLMPKAIHDILKEKKDD